MERDSKLNIPDFCTGTLSHYAVCNNNPQYTELSVLLGTAVNWQGHRNVTELTVAVVMVGIYFVLYFNIYILIYHHIFY
jgi:hypothetical protein